MIPPEKKIILLKLKDHPCLTLTAIQQLLNIEHIDTISKFYVSQKTFPSIPFYSEKEIKSLLTNNNRLVFSLKHQNIKPDITLSDTPYYSLNSILDYIITNQAKFAWQLLNFLSFFYKYFRPQSQIRCFYCRKSLKEILYVSSFTPICPSCHRDKTVTKWKWKYRDVRLYNMLRRKLLSKRGFRRKQKDKLRKLLKNSDLLPLISNRRINTIKDVTRLLSIENIRFPKSTSFMCYRIILMEKDNDERERTVSRGTIRFEKRPRSQKG